MRKKNMIGIFGIVICLMIIQISPIRGANFTLSDPAGDVTYYTDFTIASSCLNIYPEIDIESFEFEGEAITITFGAAPIADENHLVKFSVFWVGDDPLGNWTKGRWSGSENYVTTRIENSTGGMIAENSLTIDPAGLTLVIPIPNSSMIPNILDPRAIYLFTYYYVNQEDGESYQDDITYVTGQLPSFTFWITMTGISTIAVMGLIIKRKRN